MGRKRATRYTSTGSASTRNPTGHWTASVPSASGSPRPRRRAPPQCTGDRKPRPEVARAESQRSAVRHSRSSSQVRRPHPRARGPLDTTDADIARPSEISKSRTGATSGVHRHRVPAKPRVLRELVQRVPRTGTKARRFVLLAVPVPLPGINGANRPTYPVTEVFQAMVDSANRDRTDRSDCPERNGPPAAATALTHTGSRRWDGGHGARLIAGEVDHKSIVHVPTVEIRIAHGCPTHQSDCHTGSRSDSRFFLVPVPCRDLADRCQERRLCRGLSLWPHIGLEARVRQPYLAALRRERDEGGHHCAEAWNE